MSEYADKGAYPDHPELGDEIDEAVLAREDEFMVTMTHH
jgi:hypothetical protein